MPDICRLSLNQQYSCSKANLSYQTFAFCLVHQVSEYQRGLQQSACSLH